MRKYWKSKTATCITLYNLYHLDRLYLVLFLLMFIAYKAYLHLSSHFIYRIITSSKPVCPKVSQNFARTPLIMQIKKQLNTLITSNLKFKLRMKHNCMQFIRERISKFTIRSKQGRTSFTEGGVL